MKEGDDYCGFLCADIIERQQEILDEIKDFSNYNPEFALIMLGKLVKLIDSTRPQLMSQNT